MKQSKPVSKAGTDPRLAQLLDDDTTVSDLTKTSIKKRQLREEKYVLPISIT